MMAIYQTPGGRQRRLCSAGQFVVHALMPYGKWTLKDGTEILFNRVYEPLWRRHLGVVTAADPSEWIDGIVDQIWFYKSGTPQAARRKKAGAILRSWGLPEPIPVAFAKPWKETPAEWRR